MANYTGYKSELTPELMHRVKMAKIGHLTTIPPFDIYRVDGNYIRTNIDEEFSVSGKELVLAQIEGATLKLTMEELYSTATSSTQNIKVLSFNKSTLNFEWKNLKKAIRHKTADPLVLVRTRCGRELKVTQSHSCLTVDSNGEIIKIAPKDMEVGRTFLPVLRGSSLEDEIACWDISKYKVKLEAKKHKPCKFWFDSIPLTRDFGFLLGMYVAEGCCLSLHKKMLGGINLAVTDVGLRSKCVSVLKDMQLYAYIKNPTAIVFYHRQLVDAIREEFGHGCLIKQLPGWVFLAPKEFREGFIDGYWSGDGCISQTNSGSWVSFASTDSRQLAYDIQALLASLHIASHVRYFKYKSKGFKNPNEEHWRISVAGSHIGKMPKLTHSKKEEKRLLAHARETGSPHSSIAVVPIPANCTSGKIRHRGLKCHTTEEHILSESQDERLLSLAKKVFWDAVVAVTPLDLEEYTYDLEVDENHTFVLANGIAVHNTNFGQHFRYKYIPLHELWIDVTRTPNKEIPFYTTHMLKEWQLMSEGMPYEEAIYKADRIEQRERRKSKVYKKADTAHYGTPLASAYHKELMDTQVVDGETIHIWRVNSRKIRDNLYIDWVEGGHGYVYKWIPHDEVWIDDGISDSEVPFVLAHEMHERSLMKNKGWDYNRAHHSACKVEWALRHKQDIKEGLLEEYSPQKLYHGSPHLQSVLNPSPPMGDKPAGVYATPRKALAIFFSILGAGWKNITRKNGRWTVQGLTPSQLSRPGYIHTLPVGQFKQFKSWQYISDDKVKPLKVEKIENPGKALQRMGFDIVTNDIKEEVLNEAYYHLSKDNMDGRTLYPRVPISWMTKQGYENDTIPRVCFAPSIHSALKGIGLDNRGKVMYVHTPVNYKGRIWGNRRVRKHVPEAHLTGETWHLDPVKLKKVGKIKVVNDESSKPTSYKYAPGKWGQVWTDKYKHLKEEILGEAAQVKLVKPYPKISAKQLEKTIRSLYAKK